MKTCLATSPDYDGYYSKLRRDDIGSNGSKTRGHLDALLTFSRKLPIYWVRAPYLEAYHVRRLTSRSQGHFKYVASNTSTGIP